jgi:C1A family cysteine protease
MTTNRRYNGWRHDAEPAALRTSAAPFRMAREFTAPEEIDHRAWLAIEDQGNQGSCSGHALSSCLEVCNYYDTQGEIVQLSRQFAYIMAQTVDGLLGRDDGATIYGSVEGAKRFGICREELWPYSGKYVTDAPPGAKEEAARHRLLQHVVLKSYDDTFRWLASGVGAVTIGVMIRESWMNAKGTIETQSGRVVGGHAMAVLGYSKRKDSAGRNYLLLANSWGKSWGAAGWAEINPRLFDQWGSDRNAELIGVTDLEEFSPRPVDWTNVPFG